jgi:hypothetical protein
MKRLQGNLGTINTTHKLLALLALLALCGASAMANLTIDPTFGTSITSLSDAGTIEATINSDISLIDSYIANPITVTIDFENINTGLGQSQTFQDDLSYSQYLSDLENNQVLSSYDTTALASLSAGPDNPVNGNADVHLADSVLRALGETAIADNGTNFDSTISLNTGIMNLSRSGLQDTNKYDLVSVAMHEIDEVLGIGGTGSRISTNAGGLATSVGAMDLFRYSGFGIRSYTIDTNAAAYFSIDGGKTPLVYFNQSPDGDYGDWGDGVIPADGQGNTPPQVQDAFGGTSSEAEPNLGANELEALDVIGWNLTPAGLALIPEPSTFAMVALALLGAGFVRRRRT